MENNELKHHGILGMRWGVRRYQNKDGSLTPAGKKRYTTDEFGNLIEKGIGKADSKVKNIRKKQRSEKAESLAKTMTDEELQAKINRMRLEKAYKDLYVEMNPSKERKGKKFVENVLTKSGENLATQVVNYFGAKALNKMIGKDVIYENNKKK